MNGSIICEYSRIVVNALCLRKLLKIELSYGGGSERVQLPQLFVSSVNLELW